MAWSAGMTRAARISSATPQNQQCSRVRCESPWPFGMLDSAVRFSTTTHETPRRPRSTARPTPTGPPPTMTTWYRSAMTCLSMRLV